MVTWGSIMESSKLLAFSRGRNIPNRNLLGFNLVHGWHAKSEWNPELWNLTYNPCCWFQSRFNYAIVINHGISGYQFWSEANMNP